MSARFRIWAEADLVRSLRVKHPLFALDFALWLSSHQLSTNPGRHFFNTDLFTAAAISRSSWM